MYSILRIDPANNLQACKYHWPNFTHSNGLCNPLDKIKAGFALYYSTYHGYHEAVYN